MRKEEMEEEKARKRNATILDVFNLELDLHLFFSMSDTGNKNFNFQINLCEFSLYIYLCIAQ